MSELANVLRETTEAMASFASVDMALWDRHSNACLRAAAALSSAEEKAVEVPIVFGLEAQGHIPAVEAALAEGADWQEIGRRIGWDGATAKAYYERHLARSALVDVPAVESEPVGYLFEMFYPGSDRWSGQMFSDHDPAANLPAAHTRNVRPLYAHPPRSPLIQSDEGEITLSVKEAEKLAARLELDASWDKCGDGYYSIKRQLSALSRKTDAPGDGSAPSTKGCAE